MLGLSFPSIVNNSCTAVLYTTVHNSYLRMSNRSIEDVMSTKAEVDKESQE